MTERQPQPGDYTLVNLYRDSIARIRSLFNSYRCIYELPKFIHEDESVVPDAYEYATKRINFIILVLHTKNGLVFFQRSFDIGHLGMNLPGGSIRLDKEDTILLAIEKLAKKFISEAKLADIAPIVDLRNNFYCTDGRSYSHFGLGVRALLLNEEKYLTGLAEEYLSHGAFIKNFPTDEIPHPPSRKTYLLFREWFERKQYETYINELERQHEVSGRYRFHQKIINPILKGLSYVLGEYSIAQTKREIVNCVGEVNTCIDVACGDDCGIFNLLNNVNLVVANDISSDQINHMENCYTKRLSKFPKSNSILFTNHDCLDLPFKDKAFDVAICKNLLHHMTCEDHLNILLDNLDRVARKIIIVEIQDPKKESFLGRIRHQYYMRFLKDEGRNFYDKQAFEGVLAKRFGNNNISFNYFSTIRGVYMMAVVVTS